MTDVSSPKGDSWWRSDYADGSGWTCGGAFQSIESIWKDQRTAVTTCSPHHLVHWCELRFFKVKHLIASILFIAHSRPTIDSLVVLHVPTCWWRSSPEILHHHFLRPPTTRNILRAHGWGSQTALPKLVAHIPRVELIPSVFHSIPCELPLQRYKEAGLMREWWTHIKDGGYSLSADEITGEEEQRVDENARSPSPLEVDGWVSTAWDALDTDAALPGCEVRPAVAIQPMGVFRKGDEE